MGFGCGWGVCCTLLGPEGSAACVWRLSGACLMPAMVVVVVGVGVCGF